MSLGQPIFIFYPYTEKDAYVDDLESAICWGSVKDESGALLAWIAEYREQRYKEDQEAFCNTLEIDHKSQHNISEIDHEALD